MVTSCCWLVVVDPEVSEATTRYVPDERPVSVLVDCTDIALVTLGNRKIEYVIVEPGVVDDAVKVSVPLPGQVSSVLVTDKVNSEDAKHGCDSKAMTI